MPDKLEGPDSVNYQRRRAERAEHIIVEVLGIVHQDLDTCGCEMCEESREHLVDLGLLPKYRKNKKPE